LTRQSDNLLKFEQQAINGNRGAQKELSVSIKVSKEIVAFQQARVRTGNLVVRCTKSFNRISGVGVG